jgi:hypothetical protein
MGGEENTDAADDDCADGVEVTASSRTRAFAKALGEAFDEVHESGPTVETSSRSIEDDVAAARLAELADGESTEGAAATPTSDPDELDVTGDTPRKVVSSRGVDEVFDTIAEQSSPPW